MFHVKGAAADKVGLPAFRVELRQRLDQIGAQGMAHCLAGFGRVSEGNKTHGLVLGRIKAKAVNQTTSITANCSYYFYEGEDLIGEQDRGTQAPPPRALADTTGSRS